MRASLSFLFRILVAVGLTALVVWWAEPRQVGAALADTSWRWVAAAAALVVLDRALMAYRWLALLVPLDSPQRPAFSAVIRVFFLSTFVGTFLPSVGGDAVRAVGLSRLGVASSQSLASVLLDRLLGIVGLLVAAVAGLALAPDVLGERTVRWSIAIAGVGSAVAVAFVMSTTIDGWARAFLAARRPSRLTRFAEQLLSALQAYQGHRGTLGLVLVASVGVQALRVVQAWALGQSLSIDAPFLAYASLIPIVLLIMLVPISVSGLGVCQWAFQALFARVGVASAEAVALSVLFLALAIVGNLPGALLYLHRPVSTRSA